MNTCPFCQANNLDNANFCSNCGKALNDSANLEKNPPADTLLSTEGVDIDRVTDPVADDTMAALAKQSTGTKTLRSVSPSGHEIVAICFKVGENNREMILPLSRTIHIGRNDPTLDLFPEIDVTHDGPEANSVSRRHAKIAKQDDVVIIVDEGSANGTFVNQKKLKSFEYALLRSGDVVLLGRLRLEVEFITG